MPETTQSDLVERLREFETTAPDHSGVRRSWWRNPTGPEAADEIERLRAQCEAMAKALETAHDLLECIEQRSSDNMWWVKADDPETACADAYHAVDTTLAAYRKEVGYESIP